MKLPKKVIEELRVHPGDAAALADRSTRGTRADWLDHHAGTSPKDIAEHELAAFTAELAAAQELLYATDAYAVLVIVQALDAAGKDGTIKHVMSGVNPQGCEVVSFKQPSPAELAPRLPVAVRGGPPRAGPDRDLQPLLLRGGTGRPGPSGGARRRAPGTRGRPGATSCGSSATRTSTPSSATSTGTAPTS